MGPQQEPVVSSYSGAEISLRTAAGAEHVMRMRGDVEDESRNWSRGLRYGACDVVHPATLDEAKRLVARLDKVKALGSRHSFSDVADTEGTHVSLRNMPGCPQLTSDGRVRVPAAVRYGDLCEYLENNHNMLHNLASLPHISVGGSVMTGTHGAGQAHRNLASSVSEIRFVRADGEEVALARGDADFDGAVVSLGALGVATELTLDLRPRLLMRQEVYLGLPAEALFAHFDQIQALGYSVSLFTDWKSRDINQLWIKREYIPGQRDFGPEVFGARRAEDEVHPIEGADARSCTEQLGVPAPWHRILPHFKLDFTPSAGTEIQSEYFVPRAQALEMLRRIGDVASQFAHLVPVSEIRAVRGDDLWLSPCYGTDSVALHFTWHDRPVQVTDALGVIEKALEGLDVRPHWGKLCTMKPLDVQKQYPQLEAFRDLVRRCDPDNTGKFRNAFLEKWIGV